MGREDIEELHERGVRPAFGEGDVEPDGGWVGGWVSYAYTARLIEEEQAVRMRCYGFWVGGWVSYAYTARLIEEEQAVRMRCYGFWWVGGWVGGVGGWVGGWDVPW